MRAFVGIAPLMLVGCQTSDPRVALVDASYVDQQVEQVRQSRGDVSATNWKDPNGCYHYLGEIGDGEKYLQELVTPDGKPICDA